MQNYDGGNTKAMEACLFHFFANFETRRAKNERVSKKTGDEWRYEKNEQKTPAASWLAATGIVKSWFVIFAKKAPAASW